MKTRFTYFFHVALAIALVLVTLNVSIAFATSSGVKIEKNTNASTDDLDVVIQLINTPQDGSWDVGDKAEFRFVVTNKTDQAAGIDLLSTNLTGADACKWQAAEPKVAKECFPANDPQKRTVYHVITDADVQAGSFAPYGTFALYDSVGYSGEIISESSAGPVPYSNAVLTTLELANPKPWGMPWYEGEQMRFTLTLANKTEKARSFQSTASNLDGWQACKWTSAAPQTPLTCETLTHTVTAADVRRGSFTPRMTWKMYDKTAYSGTSVIVPTSYGPRVTITTNALKLTALELSSPNPDMKAGDVAPVTLTFKNIGNVPIVVKTPDSSSIKLGANCDDPLAPGAERQGSATYTVTERDLCSGKISVPLTLLAYAGTDVVGSATGALTGTLTPKCEPATPSAASNADPSAAVREPNVTLLADGTQAYNIRIPAIAVAPNGDILASFDLRPTNGRAGGGDSPNENSIMQMRSIDGGKTWQPQTVIAQGVTDANNPKGYSDPSYVVDHETGTIFNFHVYSQLSGVFANNPHYATKADGTIDEADPHTMNLGLSVSRDNGYSWEERVITSEVLSPLLKDHKILSVFATSGAGTQKMTEPHKGRLLQQAAAVVDTNGNGKSDNNVDDVVAFTIYSDDHGKTWHAGNPTDPHGIAGKRMRFDENKVVELSDGTLMLNSRTATWDGRGHRLVALSDDGGQNWKDYRIEENIVDPGNNAQIIRAFPTAVAGSLRSRVLLFSNTNSAGNRVNGTLYISYDDGATWATKKTFRTGGTGYTTMAIQPDGSIGLLLEPAGWSNVGYLNTTLSWLTPDLQSELKAKTEDKIAPVSLQDTKQIEQPILLSELFDRNDPLLQDSYEVSDLPDGLTLNPATGTIEGTPRLNNTEDTTVNVTVTLTEADDGTGRPRSARATLPLTITPHDSDLEYIGGAKGVPKFHISWSDEHNGFRGYVDELPETEGLGWTIDGKPLDAEGYTTGPHVIACYAEEGYILGESMTTEWRFSVPAEPTFDASAGTLIIPDIVGVAYTIDGVEAEAGTHTVDPGKTVRVVVQAQVPYSFGATRGFAWNFTAEEKTDQPDVPDTPDTPDPGASSDADGDKKPSSKTPSKLSNATHASKSHSLPKTGDISVLYVGLSGLLGSTLLFFGSTAYMRKQRSKRN